MLAGGSSISPPSREADEARGANVELMLVITLLLRLLVFYAVKQVWP